MAPLEKIGGVLSSGNSNSVTRIGMDISVGLCLLHPPVSEEKIVSSRPPKHTSELV
uniref:Uncharacterized protein n=1 Tax=Rhizophora mucronata TaxID=61149 RepID=A0A2P2J4M4_RHIMU